MAADPCPARAEQRSAFVDGALPHAERERLLRHLIDCAACRRDVEDLRRMRETLRREGQSLADDAPVGELSSRLVSIAGDQASVPLWSRPFDRPSPPRLPPSERQARRRWSLTGGVVLVSLAMAVAVVGWWAAPAARAEITDPAVGSTAEFSAILTQMPLTSDAMSAVLVSADADRLLTPGAVPSRPADVSAGRPLTASEAAALLQWAATASDQVSHRGLARVVVGTGRHRVAATVEVVDRAGQGTELTVLADDGSVVKQGFVPAQSLRAGGALALGQWVGQLDLTGRSGAEVAGRSATRVTATASDGSQRSWWVDDRTGLLLWQEARDPDGRVEAAAGFVGLTIADQGFWAHLGPRLAVGTTSASVAVDDVSALEAQGWFCGHDIAGMHLVRVRTDSPAAPSMIHSVYSDGVNVVSVLERHGRLAAHPIGFTRDGNVWRREGAGTRVVAWQSGHTVFTVVTNGSGRTVDRIVAALPHRPTRDESRLDRVRSGWSRIMHLVLG